LDRSASIKVGLLTLVSTGLLIFVLIWLRGRGLNEGTAYTVYFRDVDGMREGSQVQMMGIRVGFVRRIEPIIRNDKFLVRVQFNVAEEGIQLPRGSVVSIQQSGLIGDKFIEITPPQLQDIVVTLNTKRFPLQTHPLVRGMPVQLLFQGGYANVGQVEKVQQVHLDDSGPGTSFVHYRLSYRISRPGALPPDDVKANVSLVGGQPALQLMPLDPKDPLQPLPPENLQFTVENPMRLKEFLEIQIASAEALERTNDRIVQLLSDETIESLNGTLANLQVLSGRATKVLDSADQLFKVTSRDLEILVNASTELTDHISLVSSNLNEIIGDPRFKEDLQNTVASIRQSTAALDRLLNDPNIRQTFVETRETARNLNDLSGTLKQTIGDKDFQVSLTNSLNRLEDSMGKLSGILGQVQTITQKKDTDLEAIIGDTQETAENLKKFSKKLNGRFLLWRLMF
jgi:hypothetical protein